LGLQKFVGRLATRLQDQFKAGSRKQATTITPTTKNFLFESKAGGR